VIVLTFLLKSMLCVLLLCLTSVYLNLLQISNAPFIVQSDMCGGGSDYFMRKLDALGVMGFHALHKCVMAVKMLGRGSIVDDMDDMYAMAGEHNFGVCQGVHIHHW
jgi:hypothetical protein